MTRTDMKLAMVAALALALPGSSSLSNALAAPPPGGSQGGTKGGAKDGAESDPGDDGKTAPKKGRGPAKSPLTPISEEDRRALSVNVDFLIPKPTDDLLWVGTEPMTRESFRGKVTVIQTFGGKQSMRTLLERTKRQLPEGVVLLGLHTPEEVEDAPRPGATNVPCPLAVDPSGKWCDALGVWTTPVNIVINKGGAVAAVGLSEDGLGQLLPDLLAEDAAEYGNVPERPTETGAPADAPPAGEVEWPKFEAAVRYASDMRGKKMPAFTVAKWVSPQPNPESRLLAMDFWATWCPPCRAAIPHMNELNDKFGKDVLFVGISDEQEKAYNAGLKKYKLSPASFRYSVALDPAGTLKKFFNVSGIPHLAVTSADGIVRWQGQPTELTEDVLSKLVAANRQANPGVGKGGAASGVGSRGWANRKPQKSR